MAIKNTSLRIDEDILYEIKKIALEEKKTQTEIIEEFLTTGIRQRKNQTQL